MLLSECDVLPDGQLLWTYPEDKTGKPTSLKLQPTEWMLRYLQHILPLRL